MCYQDGFRRMEVETDNVQVVQALRIEEDGKMLDFIKFLLIISGLFPCVTLKE